MRPFNSLLFLLHDVSNAYNDKTRKEKMREGKRKKEKERKKKDETPLQLIHMSFVCDLCSEVI